MEKIIFFALAVPILGFVFYLGGSAIMKGFKAKVDNRPIKPEETETDSETVIRPSNSNNLSSEISKLLIILFDAIILIASSLFDEIIFTFSMSILELIILM